MRAAATGSPPRLSCRLLSSLFCALCVACPLLPLSASAPAPAPTSAYASTPQPQPPAPGSRVRRGLAKVLCSPVQVRRSGCAPPRGGEPAMATTSRHNRSSQVSHDSPNGLLRRHQGARGADLRANVRIVSVRVFGLPTSQSRARPPSTSLKSPRESRPHHRARRSHGRAPQPAAGVALQACRCWLLGAAAAVG